MDKAQKQLIDTYFRKRNIATNHIENDYEIVYALRNDIKINILYDRTYKLAELISKYPDLINKIDLDIFDYDDIVDILTQEKGLTLYKYFDLSKLPNSYIVNVLYLKPEYADIIDLSNLGSRDIEKLLRYRPNLITKLDISKLNRFEIKDVIFYHPELEKYFKNNYNG